MATHEIFVLDNGLGAARCGPVFLNIWYGPPTVERLEKLCAIQRRVMTKERHLVLAFIDPGVGREMTAAARKRANKLSDEMGPHTIALCFVVFGTGFFSAMVRSVIAGVQLVQRQKAPWKVHSDVDEGIAWALERLREENRPVDVNALRACATELLANRERLKSSA